MTLKDRILKFIEIKGITVQNFEQICGLSNAAVSKMGDNTRRSTLDKISKHFPDLNITWLLTGKGEMLAADGEGETAGDEKSGDVGHASASGNSDDKIERLLEAMVRQEEQINSLIQHVSLLIDTFSRLLDAFTRLLSYRPN